MWIPIFWHNRDIMNKKLVFFWKKLDQRFNLGLLVEYFSRSEVGLVGPTFAYYSLLTIFPIMIALVVILSLINADSEAVMHILSRILPDSIDQIIHPVLESVMTTKSKSYLSFSVIFIIWSVSQVVAVLRRTFNSIAGVEDKGSNILTRAWSFIWLFLSLISFVSLIFAVNILTIVVHSLPISPWTGFLSHQTHWALIFGIWLVLTMLNFFLPTREARPRWRYVAFGSVVELFFLNLSNRFFSWYANLQVGRYGFYESISSIVVFLIWLNLIATILVLGYVFIMWLSSFDNKEVEEE